MGRKKPDTGNFTLHHSPTGSTMELPELLDENIFDILSRLPVKSLKRFKCVSKPWCSLISDPQFIKAHFSRLDQMSSKMLVTTQREAWILDDEDSENSIVELNYPIAFQTSKLVICVGSCNGLVCLLLDSYTFILWNPSTGEFRQVPPLIPSSYDIYDTHDLFSIDFYGFGYDSSIDDYKIVIGFWTKPSVGSGYFAVQCFSQKTKEWKFIIGFPEHGFFPEHQRGILLNGNLHWISEGKPHVVLSFNIKEERFIEVVRLPAHCHTKSYQMRLYAFENSLFLCNSSRSSFTIELWEKSTDAVEDTWKRLYHVRNQILQMPFSYQLHFTRNYKLVLGFHMTGIRMYDLEAMTCKDFEKYGSPFSDGIVYQETLVSPN